MSGNSYDNPMRTTKSLGAFDFGALGAGTEATAIKVPLGMSRCRIESLSASATEVFTTGAKLELGTAADPNRYGEILFATLADTDGLDLTDKATQLFDIGHGGKGIIDIGQEAITQIELVITGAGAAGTGIAFTDIGLAWW